MNKDENKHQNHDNQPSKGEKLNENPPREDGPNTEKYLDLEQPGVTYTDEGNPVSNSDQFENENEQLEPGTYEDNNDSRNSDAFNQDEYILNTNIDLDEDQNTSISNDDKQ